MTNLILHIPHASLRIPDYSQYLLPRFDEIQVVISEFLKLIRLE
jgi:hypothetical protein